MAIFRSILGSTTESSCFARPLVCPVMSPSVRPFTNPDKQRPGMPLSRHPTAASRDRPIKTLIDSSLCLTMQASTTAFSAKSGQELSRYLFLFSSLLRGIEILNGESSFPWWNRLKYYTTLQDRVVVQERVRLERARLERAVSSS